MTFTLNGFAVAPALATLMQRSDWSGKRTDDRWLSRFPVHPESETSRLPFVQFCAPDWAARENDHIRSPDLVILRGNLSADFPPGNFDPTAGYLIGFTDSADSAIFVDLRSSTPRIIYDCLASKALYYATAFASLNDFVAFYLDVHGETPAP